MKPSLSFSSILILLLFTAGIGAQHDVEEIPITLTPEVGELVVSPAPVSLLIPMEVGFLDLGTARLDLNGLEITPLLWAFLAACPRALSPKFRGVEMQAWLALPLGEHRLRFTVQNRTGYRHEARTRFTVITREEKLLREGGSWLPVLPADITPPVITFEPVQNAFLQTPVPLITVHYTDGPGSGVNTATLKVVLDGKDVTSKFLVGPGAATYQIPAAAGLRNGRHQLSAEIEDMATNLGKASVTFIVVDDRKRLNWFFPPVNQPHTVGHAHHSFQNYSSNPSSAYFHHGIDIMEPDGTNVYASAGGLVTNIGRYRSSPLYHEVAVTDSDGFLWEYHHVDETTVPQAVRDAFKNKTPIVAGTLIGKNVTWPVRSHYGPYFHHIHLNVKDPDGRYLNGLHFLLKQKDTTAPELHGIYVIPQGGQVAFNRTGEQNVTISGNVDIVVKADDRVLPDPYHLGVYEIQFEVIELSAAEGHNVRDTVLWRFDHLPGGGDIQGQVWDVHQQSIQHDGQTHSTQGNYDGRSFYFVLTNSDGKTLSSANHWATGARNSHNARLYPDGDYRIRIKLRDESGNETVKTLDVKVKN